MLRMLPAQYRTLSSAVYLARCGKQRRRLEMPTACNCGPDSPPSWRVMNQQARSVSSCGKKLLGCYCAECGRGQHVRCPLPCIRFILTLIQQNDSHSPQRTCEL